MRTSYFQGKDGYVWWNGVVEDRKDPFPENPNKALSEIEIILPEENTSYS